MEISVVEDSKKHWETVYTENTENEVSWYQPQPSRSLGLIEATGVNKAEPIVDVGGGASTLVDHLLARGFFNISVLDISSLALQMAKRRLGDRAQSVEWIEGDVRTFSPARPFSLWHDRAVFHFLTSDSDRAAYKRALKRALRAGGHFIVATFAPNGPERCSGLDIVRYDAVSLAKFFGDSFELKRFEMESHRTPWESDQMFVYCHFVRVSEH